MEREFVTIYSREAGRGALLAFFPLFFDQHIYCCLDMAPVRVSLVG